MVELLQWAAGLGTIPKVLAALVATAIWLFILVVLFSPKPRLATPASTAPSISQQSTGPSSPNTAVVGSDNVVTVNPLPAERTIDDVAAVKIVARIAPYRGQRVSVNAAMNEEAQRLGTRTSPIMA